ncbi:MAG: site-specific DNA-methyltransferase [Clostridiales bacterium]|nr:site-specific DNA-methyltransferase [Clostridiales bacterium]
MYHNIKCGNTLELVKQVEYESIDLLVTSPPYWAKRIYNGKGEIGTEETPEVYVSSLADFFDELKPYLKATANIFINMGDTYFGSGAGAWSKYADDEGNITQVYKRCKEKYITTKPLQPKIKQNGKLYQNKQLLLIPSRFAIEMQERGWLLRNDIIWRKPNRIPSGVKDRLNNTYEHVFHFVINKKYFFNLDAIKTLGANGRMKNPGDVWSINTQPLSYNHTATFPEELVKQIILCDSPKNGVVFDPFLGTGTTWIVSDRLERNCIGFEINEEFFNFAKQRFSENKGI